MSNVIDVYGQYATGYFKGFFKQEILEEYIAIRKAFPELNFHTIARIKSMDATLEKASRKGIENIYDIHGIKHIIIDLNGKDDESLLINYCYKLENFLHIYYGANSINVISERRKDYIANPKSTNYQAIHMSSQDSKNGRKFETQIKTDKMEKVARFGSASHSNIYKPRVVGKTPLAKLPIYLPVVIFEDDRPIVYELPKELAFQYFYGVPYESIYPNSDAKNHTL